ncbi:SCP2 sterol-binding domain-containing protein [Amycolatopsis circi]|uniref:SCP2 sterol-binding domain-containing protein n=1 Tax=Amycolatopsis circi TaxID=871959 RepID=UPI000E23B6CE|nr:SCP2 sterol-binding domain-containing protein [Amycolatopsis circi]
MAYFANAAEVDQYIGEMFRMAGDHPEVGEKMKAAGIVMRVEYSDPDCVVTVGFQDPMRVESGETDLKPDITLVMRADTADKFWRGDYNLAVGLAKGQVKAKGPVNKILKLVPLTKPLFPVYRDLVKDKDAAVS